ncbi:mechanosensitive ion channel family protein [Synechococcus sp. CBW1002]|nr:mechanosensitive ion channel family protein [Synechococcus sp. CBW1002]
MALGAFVVWLASRLLKRWVMRLVGRTSSRTDDLLASLVLSTITPLAYLGVAVWGWQSLVSELQALAAGAWLDRVVEGAFQLVAIVLVVRLVNSSLLLLLDRSLRRFGKDRQIATLQSLAPMIRTLFWLLGGLVFLQNQGVEMGAIYASLAGAGIGIGLALKGPVSNFINYLTILLDQPFEIGQVIQFGGHWASVERVGIRSSSLRSLDGERIVISNEDLLSQTIRNFGDLPRRRLVHHIGVEYQTSLEKVRRIPALLQQVVEQVPPAEFDRCHFVRFADSALEFEFVYFVPGGDYVLALNVQQEVNYQIMEKFLGEAIAFAYPTQTLFLEGGSTPPAMPSTGSSANSLQVISSKT